MKTIITAAILATATLASAGDYLHDKSRETASSNPRHGLATREPVRRRGRTLGSKIKLHRQLRRGLDLRRPKPRSRRNVNRIPLAIQSRHHLAPLVLPPHIRLPGVFKVSVLQQILRIIRTECRREGTKEGGGKNSAQQGGKRFHEDDTLSLASRIWQQRRRDTVS